MALNKEAVDAIRHELVEAERLGDFYKAQARALRKTLEILDAVDALEQGKEVAK